MAIWNCEIGKGDLVAEVTGTLAVDMTGASAGDSLQYEVDHSADECTNRPGVLAVFADRPLPVFDAEGAFHVTPILDGTTGGKFRVLVTYVGSPEEYVLEGEAEEETGGDTATMNWTRRGLLAAQG